jgi:transposase-like protein
MKAKRTHRDKEFKFKVAIDAIKGNKQLAELAAEYGVHPQQITQWKKELLDKGPELFSGKSESDIKKVEKERDRLHKTIGHQQVRIDWLKKTLGISRIPGEED